MRLPDIPVIHERIPWSQYGLSFGDAQPTLASVQSAAMNPVSVFDEKGPSHSIHQHPVARLHLRFPPTIFSNVDLARLEPIWVSGHGVLSLEVESVLVVKRKSYGSRAYEIQNALERRAWIGYEIFIAKKYGTALQLFAENLKGPVLAVPLDGTIERFAV